MTRGGEAEAQQPFPAWAGPAEQLRFLLRYAVLAPSRHNTQPWLFEIDGPELRVYADGRRALRAADPRGRELVMACGAAVHNVELAALRFGVATSLEVVAGGRKDALLARLTLEEPRAAPPGTAALFLAIAARRTNRFGFDARDVPPGILVALAREAALLGGRLAAVEESLRPAVAELVGEGDRRQASDAHFRAELAAWTRGNHAGDVDGVPGYALGLSAPASLLQRLRLRLQGRAPDDEHRDRYYALHSRALLVLSTAGDAPADWLAAGRAMQRVLLRATAEGLSASYFSQALEVPETRSRLRQVLAGRGAPQLLFRLGFGGALRATPRRSVAAVLRSVSIAALPPRPIALRQPAEARP